MTQINSVDLMTYLIRVATAQMESEIIKDNTSPAAEIADSIPNGNYYLSDDGNSGYAIDPSGYAGGLFSTVKGRGDMLVKSAIGNGARNLDCFDGYLPKLYARHGFVEYKREANWTPGGPDVVFMHLNN